MSSLLLPFVVIVFAIITVMSALIVVAGWRKMKKRQRLFAAAFSLPGYA